MNNNINVISDKCCGCGLCKNICPFNAIKFIENDEGFLYPIINEDKCKECGKCLRQCPINQNNKFNISDNEFNTKAYMVISKDKVIYKNSASGGFATVISKYVIRNLNGIVYGCAMDEDGNVNHIRIDKEEELNKIQDSKYVQSNIINIFSKINVDLKDRNVLFIGTPCQVNAIKNYCNKDLQKNLITCDLICHGVPSPGIFKKYYNYISKKYNNNLKKYRFRNKSLFDKCGFRGKLTIGKKNKYFFANEDIFYDDFLKERNFRLSCYDCKYKESKRIGDFTLGDVNSWELYYDFYPELSSSLVIVNNEKAKKLFDMLESDILYREISYEKEKTINKALGRQTLYPNERKNIYDKYDNLYNNEIKIEKNLKLKLKNILKLIFPFKCRIFIKKFFKRKEKNE